MPTETAPSVRLEVNGAVRHLTSTTIITLMRISVVAQLASELKHWQTTALRVRHVLGAKYRNIVRGWI